MRVAAAALFVCAGTLHFISTVAFEKIVPPLLPAPRLLVFISGIAEIAGGIGLLVPLVRRAAGWGLVMLLIAVFPANIYMATNAVQVGSKPLPPAVLWARLPLQGLLIWWVLAVSREPRSRLID